MFFFSVLMLKLFKHSAFMKYLKYRTFSNLLKCMHINLRDGFDDVGMPTFQKGVSATHSTVYTCMTHRVLTQTHNLNLTIF